MTRQTFHEGGATEVRATVLTAGKRVDIHIFGDDAAKALGLGHLINIAADPFHPDAHKIEIDGDNINDFAPRNDFR
jgi:hypothetical protein